MGVALRSETLRLRHSALGGARSLSVQSCEPKRHSSDPGESVGSGESGECAAEASRLDGGGPRVGEARASWASAATGVSVTEAGGAAYALALRIV